ncbi:hypothetical protein TDB9533_01798 [Thalassocella blandensis]|nr:hypothetical protein TDB9533_01798 [Thalassocella blandensis]
MQNKSSQATFENLTQFRTIRRKQMSGGTELPAMTPNEVTAKVVEDINFLRGRIDHIKKAKHANTNPSILKTYESMLESRETILAWLDENYHIQINQSAQVATASAKTSSN